MSPVRKKPSSREGIAGTLRIFVVAQHVHGALDEQLALVAQLDFDSVERSAHVAGAHTAQPGKMGDQDFRGAVSFRQVEPEVAVPEQNFGSAAGAAPQAAWMHGAQPKLAEDAPFGIAVDDGKLKQLVQFFLGDLGENALLELQQEPRHGEKDGGPRALQVGEEGLDTFGEEQAQAENQTRAPRGPRAPRCARAVR